MIPVLLILWVIGWLICFRIPLCRERPTGASPPLSMIIPARNEAHNLPVLLESLRAQASPPAEILVVDDASTDETAAVARAHGATVLTAKPLPEGWRGKTWACHQGVQAAGCDLLCFVDADTRFEPGGLARILSAWQTRGGGPLSLAAWHDTPTWSEQVSAFFNLMMTMGIGAFTILGRRLPPAGLFGPFLLVTRRDYMAAGGHAAVKDRILEHVAMASRFRRAGISATCMGGRGSVSIRMYPGGLRELAAGWAKAFAAGAAGTPRWLMLASVAWMTGAILAFALPIAAWTDATKPVPPVALVYLLFSLQITLLLKRLGRFRLATGLLYPIALGFYLAVFSWSLQQMHSGRKVVWKGRLIHTDGLDQDTGHAD